MSLITLSFVKRLTSKLSAAPLTPNQKAVFLSSRGKGTLEEKLNQLWPKGISVD